MVATAHGFSVRGETRPLIVIAAVVAGIVLNRLLGVGACWLINVVRGVLCDHRGATRRIAGALAHPPAAAPTEGSTLAVRATPSHAWTFEGAPDRTRYGMIAP